MILRDDLGNPAVNTVHVCDAFKLCANMPAQSVSLIVTDPPYNGMKDEAWDNQWKTDADYLAWLRPLLSEFRRILKPNGSLYLFASPRMAARVEVLTGEYFNVLNNIIWQKEKHAGKHAAADKEILRGFFPNTERIIFAEQYGGDKPFQDALIDGNSTYWGACEAAKTSVIGDYLTAEFARANVTRKEIAALFPSVTGGLTGCVSNWLLGYNIPTPEQYQKMRIYLNIKGSGEFLRREYEDLRREYEDLRRPFFASADTPYTDVWDFATVGTYPGKHPCEKPLAMMKHIVQVSSRPNDVIFDPFCGSGSALAAAFQLGRRYVGGDKDAQWVNVARNRCVKTFGAKVSIRPVGDVRTLPLFASAGM